jgi:hypothetical protein
MEKNVVNMEKNVVNMEKNVVNMEKECGKNVMRFQDGVVTGENVHLTHLIQFNIEVLNFTSQTLFRFLGRVSFG